MAVSLTVILLITYVPFLQVRARATPHACTRARGWRARGIPVLTAAARGGVGGDPARPPSSLPQRTPRNTHPKKRTPPQPIFSTAPLSGVAWLPQLGFAGAALAYTELSKRAARRSPGGWWARRMQW